ncbi:MAG TPA: sigma-70 family RNA polymerase sigma factor [Candidatus Acidoferrales bacterium]|nr:sigma-70 family RNA polymerase sigma factor [Candidatus Acidoferrales bacterium]HXK05842.1 sigma-70 family RNA polymerase sigma factor [Verrucomicrobiae bacterium]
MAPDAGEVTLLLRSWTRGDKTALDRLMPKVYRELRRVAAGQFRLERSGHTLQATALVHEAYLRLVGQTCVDCQTRAHFFGIAANLMRQILVNHAERRGAAKRGGGNRVTLRDAGAFTEQPLLDVLALDQALDKLAKFDPRQTRIVELRFFGGLSEAEIAELLGVSITTVEREWRTARAVLYKDLSQRRPAEGEA